MRNTMTLLACLMLIACGGAVAADHTDDAPDAAADAAPVCCDYLWSNATQLCYGRGNCPPGDTCECRVGPPVLVPGEPACVFYTSCAEEDAGLTWPNVGNQTAK